MVDLRYSDDIQQSHLQRNMLSRQDSRSFKCQLSMLQAWLQNSETPYRLELDLPLPEPLTSMFSSCLLEERLVANT